MSYTVRQWEDPTSWNQLVGSLPYAHFQQSWEWGELAPELGGRAVRFVLCHNSAACGAMQVFVHPLHRTGKTHIYVPRGPALGRASVETLGPLLDAACLLGTDVDAAGIKMEPNTPVCDSGWKAALTALGLRPSYPPTQPRSSWVLDLAGDPEELLAGMKQKTRYNIRLAARKGVEVREGGPEDLDEFYPLFQETAQRDDFFIHPKPVYARMFQLFWDSGNFALFLARYQGRLIAAITLVRFGPTCWYLQGASSNEHRNLMATYLLQWEGIQWARQQGCTTYDFRAVPDLLREDQDMYGVYRFKEGFGGHQFTTLHTYAMPYQPAVFGLWQLYFSSRFALDAWQRRRQGLPARQFA